MSRPIIEINGVGKRYRIRGQRERYLSIRDEIGKSARRLSPFSRHRSSVPGRSEDFWALRDVGFSVSEGEAVGIIGRNGAGKSTLLKILSQITPPTRGGITMRGRVASLLEVGTGFHPELTGRENIYLNAAILGMRRAEVTRSFDAIVEFSGVSQFLDTPVKRYSNGMQVRLAFAVAAHLSAEVLLVDEVLAVGDVAFQAKCLDRMKDVTSSGRTVLFVSHNMGAVQALTSRGVLLHEGRLAQDGPTDETIDHYLSHRLAENAVTEYPSDPSRPIQLRRAYFENVRGAAASEFSYADGFRVVIEYEVNSRVEGCKVWFAIRSFQEVVVFASADTDQDAGLARAREPGRYRARIAVPASWLNSGRYYAAVGTTLLGTGLQRVETAPFLVVDTGVPETGRPGILQPLLSWERSRL